MPVLPILALGLLGVAVLAARAHAGGGSAAPVQRGKYTLRAGKTYLVEVTATYGQAGGILQGLGLYDLTGAADVKWNDGLLYIGYWRPTSDVTVTLPAQLAPDVSLRSVLKVNR